MNNALLALLLTLFAGLCTGIGSALTVLSKSVGPRFMALTLGFSAGVMIYVSLTEICQKAKNALCADNGELLGSVYCALSFFGGVAVIALIGALIPSAEGDELQRNLEGASSSRGALLRCGIFSAFAIALHNFPEGAATFVSALREPGFAIPIVFAVAIHNVPEGVAVAAPVLRATGSGKKAFLISFLSGLAEPVGALLCWAILMPFMSDTLYGIVFAAAAGIMVYLCADEILPRAEECGHHRLSLWGFVLGMAVMALSLILFI